MAATRRRRQRSVDPTVHAFIATEALNRELTAAEIERMAVAKFGAALVPPGRTVRDIVKENRPREKSDPWTLLNAEAGECEAVLPIVAALVIKQGRRHAVTVAEAEWIVRIREAAPDLPPVAMYHVAALCLSREESDKPAEDIEALLSFAPWRGAGAAAVYREARDTRLALVPPLRWALANTYAELLEGMGFNRKLIDALSKQYQVDSLVGGPGPDYQLLLAAQAEYEKSGSWTDSQDWDSRLPADEQATEGGTE